MPVESSAYHGFEDFPLPDYRYWDTLLCHCGELAEEGLNTCPAHANILTDYPDATVAEWGRKGFSVINPYVDEPVTPHLKEEVSHDESVLRAA